MHVQSNAGWLGGWLGGWLAGWRGPAGRPKTPPPPPPPPPGWRSSQKREPGLQHALCIRSSRIDLNWTRGRYNTPQRQLCW